MVALRLTVVTSFALSSGLTETLLYHSDSAFKQDYKSRELCRLGSGLTLAAILVENGIFTRAGVTQLVECDLAKVDVAGSNPVSRSIPQKVIRTI